MKIHLVCRATHMKKKDGDAYHTYMFHGDGRRYGCDPVLKLFSYGEGPPYPLSIRKNVYRMPAIFQPDSNLVVSGSVREKLKHINHIDFWKVSFESVFSFPFTTGDFSHYKTLGNYDEQMSFIKNAPDQPNERESLEEYYELITPKPYLKYDDLENVIYVIQDEQAGMGTKDIPYSKKSIKAFQICGRFQFFFSEDAFRLCEEYFDWSYFLHREIEIE